MSERGSMGSPRLVASKIFKWSSCKELPHERALLDARRARPVSTHVVQTPGVTMCRRLPVRRIHCSERDANLRCDLR